MLKPAEVDRRRFVIDAKDRVVGRLATEVASILRGKNKPTFTPNVDCGDSVIIINAEKIKFTGRKLDQKMYYRHSRHTGGLNEMSARKKILEKPEDVLMLAIRGMLPKTSLGRQQLTNLRIHIGEGHNHQAQKPTSLTLE